MVSASTLALIGLALVLVLIGFAFYVEHVIWTIQRDDDWNENHWSKR